MRNVYALLSGCVIATLGGLIGLGGAEFRLPLLVGAFKYRTLDAVVINLAVSMVTVLFSFIFRTGLTHLDVIGAHWGIIINILAGSLIGAYLGVNFATKINERLLIRIVVIFLLLLSVVLMGHDVLASMHGAGLARPAQIAVGFAAGIVIGIFSSMLGVAGGELIIPTIILVFGADIKLAGSLSLAISGPTIIMGLLKYRRERRLDRLVADRGFILWMVAGSIAGALLGSYLLQFVTSAFLFILLGLILLASAIKLALKQRPSVTAST